ncbi:Membrane associated serine protease, rhomboid family [Chryseobacterium piscicola]|uniref:Membrane associated serine protease, rhomboid family n=1 Tax=Chryseobacterium piscicola TaxID=551459 RepID=A0A1N7MYN5_9FLAO|nr:rhomboid family intramembrane serine protease [Chryseobacterium piscicola]PQA93884.1 rhomboid family intramembrane serine protease [Chryseobacterium piscicola]SIS91227.1 Membrane associated serine protease, rhomboid family [Chryseobacterium piscicola]
MSIIIIIIAITCIISYFALNDMRIFEKYKFNVGAIVHRKEYLRLFSAGFLHADFMHLAINMYVLYMFGPSVIREFGLVGFLIVYIGSILIGNLFSLLIYKNQSWYSAIGASGGVAGIIFAGVSLNPEFTRIGIIFIPFLSVPGYIFGLLYFGYSVYSMLNPRNNDNIGHAAHLGGAFFGLVVSVAMFPEKAMQNALFLFIMSLPLLYLAFEIFIRKKIG